MKEYLDKGYAIVTGASSGLGKEYAVWLAKHGYVTVLVARRRECLQKLKSVLDRRGLKSEIFVCDISDREECLRLREHYRDMKVEILVNAAGIGIAGEFVHNRRFADMALLDTNVCAPTLLTKLFLEIMDKGYIINIASTAGFQPAPGMSTYGASKAYLLSFSTAVNEELKRSDSEVKLITVCPGPLKTNFDANAGIPQKKTEAGKTGILRELFTVSVRRCVLYTFDMINKGRTLIIPGFMNRLLVAAGRFVPYDLMLKIEYNIQMGKLKER